MLAPLNAYTINRIEEDRRALANELHDELGSIAVLMSLELHNARNQLKARKLDELATSLSQLLNLLDALREYKHRVISGLRPPMLKELGVDLAIRGYAQDFCLRAGLDLSVTSDASLPAMDENVSLALFRVVQESLTNTKKHAFAKRVSIAVYATNSTVTIEVVDDGCGIGERRLGFGLMGIQERMQMLGGYARFERVNAFGGTRIVATVPLGNDPALSEM